MSATLSLSVTEGKSTHSGRLFHREWTGRPLAEDFWPLEVCYNAAEDEWYANQRVRSLYLRADGSEYVTLNGFHLDPDEEVETWLRSPKAPSAWRTAIDGDLVEALLAAGWVEYRP